jgi:hypothetical protein
MLFVFVPPAFKPSVVWPFVVAVTLSLIAIKLALVLVALLKNQLPSSLL